MEKKAKYQISLSENEEIFEIVIAGEVKENTAEKVTNAIAAIIKANDVKNLLMDVRAIKGRLGIAETFSIVRNLPSDRPRMNIAFVDIAENASYDSFHEATAQNAGLSFKFYSQRENKCVAASLIFCDKGLFPHLSHWIWSDWARSSANIRSISTANSRLRTTAFTSSSLKRLQ